MAGVFSESPLTNPAAYNAIRIAGVNTQGLGIPVVVTGANRAYEWDVRRSIGSQGQWIIYRGFNLAKPKIKFLLWTETRQQAFYDQILPLLAYDATKLAPKPYGVYHPLLAANQIQFLVTTNIGELVDEGSQLWTVTVETLEYRKPRAIATTEPEAAKSSTPTVQDAQDREIQSLLEQFRRPT